MVQLIKMCRLIFLLFILIAWTLCEIVVIKKQNDKIYTGHLLFRVSMPTWSVCAQYCSRVKVCKSINFIPLNKTCQINDAEPGIGDCELCGSFGNSFVAAPIFSQKLAGQCNGNDCELNQACMPKRMDYYCVPLPIHVSDRNKLINLLTSSGNYKLHINLEDFDDSRYAGYSEFIVGDATTHYTLKIGGFSGNAGNSLMFPGFTINNMMFSTKDQDNDKHSISCAIKYKSGWWLNACSAANLNGAYLEFNDVVFPAASGINRLTWRGNGYSLKATKMMIKQQ